MKRTLTALLVALGIGFGSVLHAAPAQAAPAAPTAVQAAPAGWLNWLMPTGTICVQTGGSTYWPIAQAVAAINATDVSMVAKASCKGYPRNMTVTFSAYYSSSDGACASAYSTAGFSWRYVRGVWTWTPNAPNIKINFWSRIKASCQATYRKRLYLMSHELLHIVGLAHATGVTVMLPHVNETYVLPTARDRYLIDRRY